MSDTNLEDDAGKYRITNDGKLAMREQDDTETQEMNFDDE